MDTETLRVPLRTVGLVARDISDGLILLDSFGTVQFINPSAGRLLARRFFPAVVSPDEPLFYWNVLRPIDLLYIPNVVLQEFLVRGVTQGSIERILPENYSPAVSIIVSSLFFGSIHIHKGIVYMVGAALLLAFFGALYKKQKTIWGLCIPHLFLSWSLRVIWGF